MTDFFLFKIPTGRTRDSSLTGDGMKKKEYFQKQQAEEMQIFCKILSVLSRFKFLS